MDFEAAGPRVALVAISEGACEGLLACVGQLVRLEVALRDELALAELAREGPLARMRAHVRFQISRLRELLQAAPIRTNQDLGLVLRPGDLLDELYTYTLVRHITRSCRGRWLTVCCLFLELRLLHWLPRRRRTEEGVPALGLAERRRFLLKDLNAPTALTLAPVAGCLTTESR